MAHTFSWRCDLFLESCCCVYCALSSWLSNLHVISLFHSNQMRLQIGCLAATVQPQLPQFNGCSAAWGKPNRACLCFIEIPLYVSNEENKLTIDAIYFPQNFNMAAGLLVACWESLLSCVWFWDIFLSGYFYLVDTHTHTYAQASAELQYLCALQLLATLPLSWALICGERGSRGNAIGWELQLI